MSTTDHTSTVPVPAEPALDYHLKYTVQKGVFMQSEDETDDKSFDFVRSISIFPSFVANNGLFGIPFIRRFVPVSQHGI